MALKVRESAKRRFVVWSVWSGWIALAATALMWLALAVAVWNIPDRVDVHKEISSYSRAEYFARTFFVTWATGSNKSQATVDALKRMSSAPFDLSEINASPIKVTNINTVDVRWTNATDGTVEWAFTFGATLAPPGGKVGRSFFRVTLVEQDKAFQALVLPRPVNVGVDAIQVRTVYDGSIDPTSELGTLLTNFATAYLVPSQSGRLGGYVTENFTETSGAAVSAVPYVSSTVRAINYAGGAEPANANPGDVFDVLVTTRAAVTGSTFNLVQLPLLVRKESNGGWLVDQVVEPVLFGATEPR